MVIKGTHSNELELKLARRIGTMVLIESVIAQKEYKLQVNLENGSSIILDFSDRLHTVRFGLLINEDFFQAVTTNGHFIRWENKIEISLSEVFQLAQKKRLV